MTLPPIYMDVFLLTVLLAVFLAIGVVVGWILVRRSILLIQQARYLNLLKMMSNADHILRNYITSIQGNLNRMGEAPLADWKNYRDAVWQAASQMERHLQRFRLIREGLDPTTIEVSPVNLARLIEQILITLEPAATDRNITLRLEINPQVPPVPGDTLMLEEIFTSLLDNAIKYNPSGTEVVAEVTRQNGMALVRVSDTGRGIREELLRNIIQEGVRNNDAGEPRGNGMGLYIARMLTEIHGGTIQVESQVGQGTIVCIALPFERPDDTRENTLKGALSRLRNYLGLGMPAKPGVALFILMIIITVGVALLWFGGGPTPPSFRLTILHNNDGESKLMNLGPNLEDFGGVARFAAVVRREKQLSEGSAGRNGVIMVSSGDNFLPGPVYTAGERIGTFFDAVALDLIGYDAIVLGNQDFYFGPKVLAEFIQKVADSEAPFLSANLDFSDEPVLQALYQDHRLADSVVVQKNGERIGIIGVTTPNLHIISSPGKVRIIPDMAGAVQAEVNLLEAGGVNKIVLISHLQDLKADIALVGQIYGVDVVVAGGGNELLANEDDPLIPRAKDPDGPYPIFATDFQGTRVPLVTTPGQYGYLGKLVVQFDQDGNAKIDKEASRPIRIAGGDNRDAVEPDPQMQRMVVDPLVEILKPEPPAPPIAISQVSLDGRRDQVRSRETNLGNLMADSLLWQAKRVAVDYGAASPDVALQNGGGIRNGIVQPAGPIQLLNTFDMAPFPNLVAVLENISREQFKEILENAVSDPEGGSGRFAQVSGFSFQWSESGAAQVLGPDGRVQVAGTRIQRVLLDDGTVIVDAGAVEPGPALTLTVIDFLAKGGDEYPFQSVPFTNLGVTYQQALANYLQDPDALNGTVTSADYPPGGEGRIKRRP